MSSAPQIVRPEGLCRILSFNMETAMQQPPFPFPFPTLFLLFPVYFLVMICVTVIVVVALWRAMRAHERIAERLGGIEQALSARMGDTRPSA